jgi:hypothetical protein
MGSTRLQERIRGGFVSFLSLLALGTEMLSARKWFVRNIRFLVTPLWIVVFVTGCNASPLRYGYKMAIVSSERPVALFFARDTRRG